MPSYKYRPFYGWMKLFPLHSLRQFTWLFMIAIGYEEIVNYLDMVVNALWSIER